MIKLKMLPAGLIVGACVLVAGFFLVRWIIKIVRTPPPHPHQAQIDELEDPEGPVVAQQWCVPTAVAPNAAGKVPRDDVRELLYSTNLVDWHHYGTMVNWTIVDPMTNACMFWHWAIKPGAIE